MKHEADVMYSLELRLQMRSQMSYVIIKYKIILVEADDWQPVQPIKMLVVEAINVKKMY